MITKENSRTIERVQKSALAIILSPNYNGYDSALHQTNLQRLDIRRTISINISNWFCKQLDNMKMKTRAPKPTFKPAKARTQRLLKFPIPYLTKLLNCGTKIWKSVASHASCFQILKIAIACSQLHYLQSPSLSVLVVLQSISLNREQRFPCLPPGPG